MEDDLDPKGAVYMFGENIQVILNGQLGTATLLFKGPARALSMDPNAMEELSAMLALARVELLRFMQKYGPREKGTLVHLVSEKDLPPDAELVSF